jgi:hypothetical protein
MSIANEAYLVTSIVLDIIHKVNAYLLVTFRDRVAVVDTSINETFIVIQLRHFKSCCICPLSATIDFIKPEGCFIAKCREFGIQTCT